MILTMELSPMIEREDPAVEGVWLLARALALVNCGDGFSCLWHRRCCTPANLRPSMLKDGQRVVGEIIAERPTAIYVDLGYDILRIPRDQVLRRTKGAEAAVGPGTIARTTEEDATGFYTSGVLKPSPIKELVNQVWRGGDLDRDSIG